MTTGEMITQVHENAGEPSDLDPWVPTPTYVDPDADILLSSRGCRHYLKAISDAQILLSNWKTQTGKPIRFRSLQVQRNAKLTLDDQTEDCIIADGEKRLRIVKSTGTFAAHFQDGSLESSRCDIAVTYQDDTGEIVTEEYTQMAMFSDFNVGNPDDTAILYFAEAFELPRDEDDNLRTILTSTVKFSFDRFKILRDNPALDSAYLAMPTSFRNILKVTDSESSSPLKRAYNKEALYNPTMTTGTPSEYYVLGDTIYFDVYFEEPRWFVVEYQKIPDRLQIVNSSLPPLELPEEWHDVLVAVVDYNQAVRNQENDLAQKKASYVDWLIRHMRTDAQEDALRDDLGNYQIEFSS
jgi:hypothetical protein